MRYSILLVSVIATVLVSKTNAAPLLEVVPFDNQARTISSNVIVKRNENELDEDEPNEDEGDEDAPPKVKNEDPPTQAPALSPPSTAAAPATLPPPAVAQTEQTPPKSPLQSLTDATVSLTTVGGGAAQDISTVATGLTGPQGLSNIGTTANDVTTVAATLATANGVGAIAGGASTNPIGSFTPVGTILNAS